ncbi:L-aspartate oxidase [Methylocystis sp. MJC1]|jgi:L-aspartate oxidase|uniref:L-aspartate oxidase n=1 Tax=Methylocystis sp. MJC1 TaxID=2654282 RepID=UPI0013EA3ED9|nr:L-aspartate oxidase [Methylocystis sp. MJC1]KAF2991707.1 L-aspartate oxidase [Methylocystis sp. MJC1]MBU6527054.1 L-aspartate oxidase [Methylocystis sp. MJC1]UZX13491.1 L-aspartate oxidase [Methylocystis sp. MJC1]
MPKKLPPIIIVGGGLAGVFCALKLAPHPVAILAPTPLGASGSSYWAQGGIAAAVEDGDTPERHAEDTMAAGAGIVDAEMALGMAQEARARVEDLAAMGAPFDRKDGGAFSPSREAAHSCRRVVRVMGDGAGRAIMETLERKIAETPSVTVVDGYSAQEIITRDRRVVGVRARHASGRICDIPCSALVLATGGVGHLYRLTTNPVESRGVGLAMAARAGAIVADAEFVQFHPTAIDIDADPAPLATEALRGEGAIIVDREGRRFLLDVDPAAELGPRDIVARGVFASVKAGRGAFLDARAAVGAEFPLRFPTVYASCRAAGLDPVTEPIPIAPAAHYHMGGVWTDARGRTSVSGLWAVGEVASTGVHGANRLASNSLLEAVVFGARVADDIAATPLQDIDLRVGAERAEASARESDFAIIEELRDLMSANVGVIRDAAGLSGALKAIRRLSSRARDIEVSNMLTTALMISASSLARRESRGAQFRADYPQPDPAFARRSQMTLAEALRVADEVGA